MATVKLKKLVKKYGDVGVVHGIDLDIASGEFIVLVGPSGCGKSTTLRMLAGLEEITGGTAEIDERVVNDVAPKDRDIAMVFQNYALYPHMSVRENMSFALKLQKQTPETINEKVNEAAKILNLEDYLDRKPSELSGGQRQRVAMGRAIVRNPKVFLFDEPLSNLDAKLRTQMRAEIKRLHMRMKATTVYVTHDQVEAMTLADRIVIMNGGVIEQVGTPLEVYSRPANTFVANFIGSPPMNVRKANDFADWNIPKDSIVGLRPEKFSLTSGDYSLKGPVEFIEPLGGETLVHVSLNGENIIARLSAGDLPAGLKPGGDIQLYIPKEHVHFFDQKSQKRIEV